MQIFLIRHGQKATNQSDPPLTTLGQKQAQKTANCFSGVQIDRLIASPLQRTQQTAGFIAAKLNLDVNLDHRLVERAEWVKNEVAFKKFVNIWKQASKTRHWQPPIGDSSVQAGNRIHQVIDQEFQNHKNNIILVTHGGVITDFLRNITSDQFLITNFFKNNQQLIDTQVGECSITKLEKNGNDYQILSLFETSHLINPQD